MQTKLAIVIPAFKSNFLRNTLESIAQQTNQNFRLYIGDDGSPDELYPIIREFEKRIKLNYTFFKENLGSVNLVGHWERCIDMVQEEEWVWLFSDDDVMQPTCVDNFYLELRQNHNSYDLYHFNVNVINGENRVIKKGLFPDIIQSEQLLKKKLRGKLRSYVVEFIFNKEEFFLQGRFQNFELAWNSDIATWIKVGHRKGIKTIENSIVQWRSSEYNISPNHNDPKIVLKKMAANKNFCKWLIHFCKDKNLSIISIYPHLASWFIASLGQYKSVYDQPQRNQFLISFFKITNTKFLYPFGRLYLKLKEDEL